jgi:hydroxymethylpyrimidine pyrophosphatase-like HAD family hydrolase
MAPGLVSRATNAIIDAGHAALVAKDRASAGFDYLVVVGTESRALDPVSVWWFSALNVETRFVATLDEDEHPEFTVRVGLVADAQLALPFSLRLQDEFAGEALLHSFPAVISSGDRREVHVLEIFDPRAHKWSAVQWFLADRNTPTARVAAIGDHINDLSMLREADLGIAMGNATPEAIAAANVVTLTNDQDGAAFAIGQLLDGSW